MRVAGRGPSVGRRRRGARRVALGADQPGARLHYIHRCRPADNLVEHRAVTLTQAVHHRVHIRGGERARGGLYTRSLFPVPALGVVQQVPLQPLGLYLLFSISSYTKRHSSFAVRLSSCAQCQESL